MKNLLVIVGLIVGSIIVVLVLSTSFPIEKSYVDKFRNAVANDGEEVMINQIFDFDFNRAYVLHAEDCYMSGSEFSENYNLDLSIDEVDEEYTETVKRIIFVDNQDRFIYLFRYDTAQIDPKIEGIIIYPTTRIRKCPTWIEGSVGIEFLDIKESDYY